MSALPIALPALLQATQVEPLPDEAAATATELANNAEPAVAVASSNLDMLQLVLHASIPVQLVMLLLLFASIASWVIIFRKMRVLNRAENEAVRFEERFWSGADLGKWTDLAAAGRPWLTGKEAVPLAERD